MTTLSISKRSPPADLARNAADLARSMGETAWLLRTVSRTLRRQHSGLTDIEFSIVMVLGTDGAMRRCDLADRLTRDASQIGISVRALTYLGFIDGTVPRAPVSLTPAGRKIFVDLVRITEVYERELLRDLPPFEIEAAERILQVIFEAARDPDSSPARAVVADSPPLITLLRVTVLAMRRADNADGRQVLAAFDRDVLLRLARQPASLTMLSRELKRDKAQLSRVMQSLKAAGLIAAVASTDRQIWFCPTRRGERFCRAATERTKRRMLGYMGDIESQDIASLQQTLNKLRRNALALRDWPGMAAANQPSGLTAAADVTL